MGQLTVGSLFAGIGGFDLGLERAGMRVIWQSEIDPYASAVLRKHWPAVPNLGDIRGVRWHNGWLVADSIIGHGIEDETVRSRWDTVRTFRPDVLCGGFPCQDISNAGKRAGIDGERSGLWSEFARLIGELRPRYAIMENVAALLGRGIERVCGDLAEIGYDAEWQIISAADVGAPHLRERVWIVAYSTQLHGDERGDNAGGHRQSARQVPQSGNGSRNADVADTDDGPILGAAIARSQRDSWIVEPDVGRVAHGVPSRVDRLRCLGNAIVPQIAEIIGRAIVSSHG